MSLDIDSNIDLKEKQADFLLSNHDLLAVLREKADQAESWHNSLLAEDQANAIDFYEARPFGDEEDGRSQVVSPDVAEVVDYMTISLLRTIVSGDRVIEFEPIAAEQAQDADDATEAVSYAFMHGQDGYKILHDWIQSGLIEKIGIIKTAVLSERRATIRHITVDDDALAALLMEAEDNPDIQITLNNDDGSGQYEVTVTRYQLQKRYVDMPIPSEEYRVSARTRHEDDADYQAHVSYKRCLILFRWGSIAILSRACQVIRVFPIVMAVLMPDGGMNPFCPAVAIKPIAKFSYMKNMSASIGMAMALLNYCRFFG